MFRHEFLVRICAVVLGVNVGAWAISVGVTPGSPTSAISIPITPAGIQAESLSAGVAPATLAEPNFPSQPVQQIIESTSTSTSTPQ
ncbi:MAG: hypothetical protein JWO50_391 [Candidatus Kaiserbacteria bacterium]|nr:hypothetical protein [Candidatus Kaiserbacteria bacterium]